MRYVLAALVAPIVLSLFTACGNGGGKSTPTAAVTSAALAATLGTATMESGAGGTASIFPPIFAALAADDRSPLIQRMVFTGVPCITTPQGLDAEPPCPTGTAAGSLVEAFPFAMCQGAFVPKDRAQSELYHDLLTNASYASLYAVYRTEGTYFATSFFAPAAADAVAVFLGGESPNMYPWALILRGDRIVGFEGACNETLEDFLSTRHLTTLVKPPTVRHTGIPEVDATLDAVQSGNVERLRSLIAFQPMACTATPQGIGPFYCETAEPGGTQVGVIPSAGCEGSFLRSDEDERIAVLTNPSFELYAVSHSGEIYNTVFSYAQAQSPEPGVVDFRIEGGRITAVYYGCGDTPSSFVARTPPQDFVLPPR